MKGLLAFSLLMLVPAVAYGDPKAPAGPTAPVLSNGVLPIGCLGFPLGTYLTIEGQRLDGFKTGVQTLQVDTVNGKKLDQPITIWVENIGLPPAPSRSNRKGYETVRMIGVPAAEAEAAKEAGKEYYPPQSCWQMQVYFVALSGAMLKEARLKDDPVAAIKAVLPEGWTVVKVEDGVYPPQRRAGNGKAISLAARSGEVTVIVYLMPADYQDGAPLRREPRTTNPASLIAATPTSKIYLWEQHGQFSAPGWPKLTDDVLKAIMQ